MQAYHVILVNTTQMIEVDAQGIAMLECHEDPDVFRTRFGKAINFEYHEVSTPNDAFSFTAA
jgi:hypothetical protein